MGKLMGFSQYEHSVSREAARVILIYYRIEGDRLLTSVHKNRLTGEMIKSRNYETIKQFCTVKNPSIEIIY